MARPIKYQQADARWGSVSYSAKGESTTIGKAGCGPTCCAMVIASLKDKNVTPKETCAWSLKHGYKALKQGTYYTYFAPQLAQYGIECRRVNTVNIYGSNTETARAAHNLIESELKAGNWIIACMGKGVWTSSGHYVLAYKTEGGRIYINDPASEKAMRECNDLKLWESQVKYYWIVEVPKAPKEDDEVVEDKKIELLGKDYTAKTIFKDGSNYISPKVLSDAGFRVSSEGSKAIVDMDDIPVTIRGKEHTVKGINSNGTVYAGLRELIELVGLEVGWEDGSVVIK